MKTPSVSSCFGDIKLEEKQEHEQDDDEVETPCASNRLGHRKLEEEEEEEDDDEEEDLDDHEFLIGGQLEGTKVGELAWLICDTPLSDIYEDFDLFITGKSR